MSTKYMNMFQYLIGRLKTMLVDYILNNYFKFQYLIGRLKTKKDITECNDWDKRFNTL